MVSKTLVRSVIIIETVQILLLKGLKIMKIYLLIGETNTDYSCGGDAAAFLDKQAAQDAMRKEWTEAVESWEYNSHEHKNEDECYCEDDSAVIREGINSEYWHIEEQELDVQVAVDVHEGMVQAVHANADIGIGIYDRDINDDMEALEAVEKELEECVNAPGWRAIW